MSKINLYMFRAQRTQIQSAMYHLRNGCFLVKLACTFDYAALDECFNHMVTIKASTFNLLDSHGAFKAEDGRYYLSDTAPEFNFDLD